MSVDALIFIPADVQVPEMFDAMYYDECVTPHDRIAFIPLTISNLMTSVRDVGCWSEEVTIGAMYSECKRSRCELQLCKLQPSTVVLFYPYLVQAPVHTL